MSVTDYVIDILLIAVIFRQVRARHLTPRSALLPLALLAVAGVVYLRPFTVGGNDVALIVVLTVIGLVLGAGSGLADKVWQGEQGSVISRATAVSVITWVLGMGFRFGFAYYSYHSGAHAVSTFSAHHDITGARIWTTAFVLMAFGQGLARIGVLQLRRHQTARASVVVGQGGHGSLRQRSHVLGLEQGQRT